MLTGFVDPSSCSHASADFAYVAAQALGEVHAWWRWGERFSIMDLHDLNSSGLEITPTKPTGSALKGLTRIEIQERSSESSSRWPSSP